MPKTATNLRPPAELRFADELTALKANDELPKPPGWQLSPRAVRQFILGSDGQALPFKKGKKTLETVISQKDFGDNALIDRCVVTLARN